MQIRHIAIRPSQGAVDAGDIALTPELLAAVGARHSRNAEGIESILTVAEGLGDEEAVEKIFRLFDYGHASIADMVPVAINIEGVSLWLAYTVWAQCPLAGGQETSTRYCDMDHHSKPEDAVLWIGNEDDWQVVSAIDDDVTQAHADFLKSAYKHYKDALAFWTNYANCNPSAVAVPEGATTAVRVRIRRQFAFDRARYYLPIAAKTNLMIVQSARAWVTLIRSLLSSQNFEEIALGKALVPQLAKSAPSLIKHAVYNEAHWNLSRREWFAEKDNAQTTLACAARPVTYQVPEQELWLPGDNAEDTALQLDLSHRKSRYDPVGRGVALSPVAYDIFGVAFAEVRDMNRHRTGTKALNLAPLGFYAPEQDEYADHELFSGDEITEIGARLEFAHRANEVMLARLAKGRQDAIYWGLLGTQMEFCHSTTLDKAIYEFELRTGEGAHFRYKKHYKEWLRLLYAQNPALRGLILEGE